MFPISDDNPTHITPVVTWTVIGLCVLVFLWQFSLDTKAGHLAALSYGMIPARVFGLARLPEDLAPYPPF